MTEYGGRCNVLFRLNAEDTKRLINKLEEHEMEKGLNLIFFDMKFALSWTNSPERGDQVKVIGFSDSSSFGIHNIDPERDRYGSEWSGMEIAGEKDEVKDLMKRFAAQLELKELMDEKRSDEDENL